MLNLAAAKGYLCTMQEIRTRNGMWNEMLMLMMMNSEFIESTRKVQGEQP